MPGTDDEHDTLGMIDTTDSESAIGCLDVDSTGVLETQGDTGRKTGDRGGGMRVTEPGFYDRRISVLDPTPLGLLGSMATPDAGLPMGLTHRLRSSDDADGSDEQPSFGFGIQRTERTQSGVEHSVSSPADETVSPSSTDAQKPAAAPERGSETISTTELTTSAVPAVGRSEGEPSPFDPRISADIGRSTDVHTATTHTETVTPEETGPERNRTSSHTQDHQAETVAPVETEPERAQDTALRDAIAGSDSAARTRHGAQLDQGETTAPGSPPEDPSAPGLSQHRVVHERVETPALVQEQPLPTRPESKNQPPTDHASVSSTTAGTARRDDPAPAAKTTTVVTNETPVHGGPESTAGESIAGDSSGASPHREPAGARSLVQRVRADRARWARARQINTVGAKQHAETASAYQPADTAVANQQAPKRREPRADTESWTVAGGPQTGYMSSSDNLVSAPNAWTTDWRHDASSTAAPSLEPDVRVAVDTRRELPMATETPESTASGTAGAGSRDGTVTTRGRDVLPQHTGDTDHRTVARDRTVDTEPRDATRERAPDTPTGAGHMRGRAATGHTADLWQPSRSVRHPPTGSPVYPSESPGKTTTAAAGAGDRAPATQRHQIELTTAGRRTPAEPGGRRTDRTAASERHSPDPQGPPGSPGALVRWQGDRSVERHLIHRPVADRLLDSPGRGRADRTPTRHETVSRQSAGPSDTAAVETASSAHPAARSRTPGRGDDRGSGAAGTTHSSPGGESPGGTHNERSVGSAQPAGDGPAAAPSGATAESRRDKPDPTARSTPGSGTTGVTDTGRSGSRAIPTTVVESSPSSTETGAATTMWAPTLRTVTGGAENRPEANSAASPDVGATRMAGASDVPTDDERATGQSRHSTSTGGPQQRPPATQHRPDRSGPGQAGRRWLDGRPDRADARARSGDTPGTGGPADLSRRRHPPTVQSVPPERRQSRTADESGQPAPSATRPPSPIALTHRTRADRSLPRAEGESTAPDATESVGAGHASSPARPTTTATAFQERPAYDTADLPSRSQVPSVENDRPVREAPTGTGVATRQWTRPPVAGGASRGEDPGPQSPGGTAAHAERTTPSGAGSRIDRTPGRWPTATASVDVTDRGVPPRQHGPESAHPPPAVPSSVAGRLEAGTAANVPAGASVADPGRLALQTHAGTTSHRPPNASESSAQRAHVTGDGVGVAGDDSGSASFRSPKTRHSGPGNDDVPGFGVTTAADPWPTDRWSPTSRAAASRQQTAAVRGDEPTARPDSQVAATEHVGSATRWRQATVDDRIRELAQRSPGLRSGPATTTGSAAWQPAATAAGDDEASETPSDSSPLVLRRSTKSTAGDPRVTATQERTAWPERATAGPGTPNSRRPLLDRASTLSTRTAALVQAARRVSDPQVGSDSADARVPARTWPHDSSSSAQAGVPGDSSGRLHRDSGQLPGTLLASTGVPASGDTDRQRPSSPDGTAQRGLDGPGVLTERDDGVTLDHRNGFGQRSDPDADARTALQTADTRPRVHWDPTRSPRGDRRTARPESGSDRPDMRVLASSEAGRATDAVAPAASAPAQRERSPPSDEHAASTQPTMSHRHETPRTPGANQSQAVRESRDDAHRSQVRQDQSGTPDRDSPRPSDSSPPERGRRNEGRGQTSGQRGPSSGSQRDYPGRRHEPKAGDTGDHGRSHRRTGRRNPMSDRSGERDRVASEMTLSDVLASEAETDRMTAKLYRELERKIAIEKRRRGNR